MKAIVRQAYGGPEQLRIEEVPDPVPGEGEVLVRVRAFGLNRAEQYFRLGLWGEVASISGIECVGEIEHDPSGRLLRGQKVLALMGGMGRTRSGSYAELVCVPEQNVVPVRTRLPWERLAALPETFATAWSCLHDNLQIGRGDVVLIRGSTSALGQAAVQLAAGAGARVIAAIRTAEREPLVRQLGATWSPLETSGFEDGVREIAPRGVDAVLDLVGTRTILQSLRLARRAGRVCLAGFLGGGEPIASLDPMRDLPSGRHLSFFGSAFVYGTADYPLTDVPFQHLIDRSEDGRLHLQPARVFAFEKIQEAHRLLDAEASGGKIVISLG
ncbi:zinc-binding dehydrogenase [Piscinibacter terrae]|uniref:Alcohol dehydrogenase n=1 Tax=Piscinibacter terrae TaxID=2496871 RepID=A0A3N7IZS5_9BURK|nr:zinc-binding dehydrogenase [Albitalea terrae]RQP24212.1 alcohol dehydrogenase [Albitalea terrae]